VGTGNKNTQGLGVVLALQSEKRTTSPEAHFPQPVSTAKGEIVAVPVTVVYNRGLLMKASDLLKNRIPQAELSLHPADAAAVQAAEGDPLVISWSNHRFDGRVAIDDHQPQGVLLVKRDMGIPLTQPEAVSCALAVRESNLNR
jgi:hypothetical protein